MRKRKCFDCKHKLKGHEKTRCDHCRALDNLRHVKRRLLRKGILCVECFCPISIESNGGYLTCTNCRILRTMRKI